jgi:PIN domain nuclease of toxin-antitoxin system
MAVLDASAVLALLNNEPGAAKVTAAMNGALISAVNLAEVAAKLSDYGMAQRDIEKALGNLDLKILPLDEAGAFASAALRQPTRPSGLSLGDRCCLALGQALGDSVLTADRAWTTLKLGITVTAIR